MTDQGRPLFLVVTTKPRRDRLEEAEVQLQSMRRNALPQPGGGFMHLLQPHGDLDTWVAGWMLVSRGARDEHMRQPYSTEGNEILKDLLRNPPIYVSSTRGQAPPAQRALTGLAYAKRSPSTERWDADGGNAGGAG